MTEADRSSARAFSRPYDDLYDSSTAIAVAMADKKLARRAGAGCHRATTDQHLVLFGLFVTNTNLREIDGFV